MAVYRKYNNQWQNKATENVNITYAFALCRLWTTLLKTEERPS